jgi:FkbM family methyltransferase
MRRLAGLTRRPPPPWERAYDPAATEDDIHNCFRLLLGRPPNREEWTGHASRVGEDLDGVVASYVSSLEFSRRGLLSHDHMADLALVDGPGFRIYAAADDAAVGRHVRSGEYEPEVTAVFRRLLRPGMGVIDLGANIGWFTMLSAALVGPSGYVLAVEPNPRNARMLEASRLANGFANVTLSQTAAGPGTGLLVLHRSHSNGTTSAAPADAVALLSAETVACVRPDALVPAGRRIDLIKADVEGAEHLALLGCTDVIRRDRPTIVSEFSPDLMPGISGIDGPGYLDWLMAQGHRLSAVQPDGSLLATPTAKAVMDVYRARGTDHVDIVASPA